MRMKWVHVEQSCGNEFGIEDFTFASEELIELKKLDFWGRYEDENLRIWPPDSFRQNKIRTERLLQSCRRFYLQLKTLWKLKDRCTQSVKYSEYLVLDLTQPSKRTSSKIGIRLSLKSIETPALHLEPKKIHFTWQPDKNECQTVLFTNKKIEWKIHGVKKFRKKKLQKVKMICLLCLCVERDEHLLDIVAAENRHLNIASILHTHFGFCFQVSCSVTIPDTSTN